MRQRADPGADPALRRVLSQARGESPSVLGEWMRSEDAEDKGIQQQDVRKPPQILVGGEVQVAGAECLSRATSANLDRLDYCPMADPIADPIVDRVFRSLRPYLTPVQCSSFDLILGSTAPYFNHHPALLITCP